MEARKFSTRHKSVFRLIGNEPIIVVGAKCEPNEKGITHFMHDLTFCGMPEDWDGKEIEVDVRITLQVKGEKVMDHEILPIG